MSDGSIRITTKLDTLDAEKDLKKLEGMCKNTADNIKSASQDIFGKNLVSIKSDAQLAKIQKRMAELKKEIEDTKAATDEMLSRAATDDQAVRVLDMETEALKKIQAEYDNLAKSAEAYNMSKQAGATQKAEVSASKEVAAGVGASMAANEFVGKIASAEEYNAVLAETQQRIATIEAETARLATSRGIKTEDALAANKEYLKLQDRLKALTAAQGQFGKTAKTSFTEAGTAAKNCANSAKNILKSMGKVAIGVLGARTAFSFLRGSVQQYMQDNQALAASVSSLKGAFAEVLGPAIEWVVNLLRYAMAYLMLFIKILTGVDVVARYNAKAMKNQAAATGTATKAQQEYNKVQQAGFDEQTKLQDNSASSAGGGGGSAAGGAAAGVNLPDVSGGKFEAFAQTVKDNLALIGTIASGATLALGAVLLFTGANIPLGLGLIALGALGLAKSVPPLWNSLPSEIKGVIAIIFGIVSIATLVIGATLIFSGAHIPLGLGLLVAGAAGLAGAMPAMWETIPNKTKEIIAIITAIGAPLLLVIGLVLALTGAALPLGLGLMAAGAVGLASAIPAMWNSLSDKVKSKITTITTVTGTLMLALGIILCLTGVGIPLGIGLILAGAASIGTAVSVNWNFITQKVASIWNSVKGFWRSNIAPVFTTTWWKKIFSSIGNGMKAALNGVLWAVETAINWIVSKMNKLSWEIPDWVPLVGGKKFGFDMVKVSIPRLAKGGIVNVPTRGVLANIGEDGAEAVLPLEKNTEWIDMLASRLGGNLTVPIYLDGKKIANYVIDLNKKKQFSLNGGLV